MEKTFPFTLRTPLETIFDGDVEVVRLKTDLGRMEILPEHATLVATILYSRVVVRAGGTEEVYMVRQASVVVDESGAVRVTALTAHKTDELTVDSIQDYLKHVNKQLSGERELNDYQKKFLDRQRAALEENLENLNE